MKKINKIIEKEEIYTYREYRELSLTFRKKNKYKFSVKNLFLIDLKTIFVIHFVFLNNILIEFFK
ncbi:hypothetical protein [Guillardia theta]|uniref:Uncharacterized protein n=1 Tax=Guillardia theta TaxID=55529 RepID=Q9AVZ4_GUITH|nr:hypothetical protein GTHECHR2170 [Guillardia theta]CAC27077.1 hypothetical protein [Guillardia theta]